MYGDALDYPEAQAQTQTLTLLYTFSFCNQKVTLTRDFT